MTDNQAPIVGLILALLLLAFAGAISGEGERSREREAQIKRAIIAAEKATGERCAVAPPAFTFGPKIVGGMRLICGKITVRAVPSE